MNIVTLTNQELDIVLQGLRELPLKVSGELFEKLKYSPTWFLILNVSIPENVFLLGSWKEECMGLYQLESTLLYSCRFLCSLLIHPKLIQFQTYKNDVETKVNWEN